jgi:hypothetical protein
MLEERAQEFRDKATPAASQVAKKRKVSKKDLPESPSGGVAATTGDEPKVKKVAAAKTAAQRAKTAPAPKRSKGRQGGRPKGRRSSRVAKESKSDTDAKPTSASEEHSPTPTGTEPPPGGATTPDSVAASAGTATSAAAANPSSAGPGTAATAEVRVLSGGSDTDAKGSQGTSDKFPQQHQHISSCRTHGNKFY